MHRSAQTVKQIGISTTQNNVSNYYKHLDEFKIFIESNKSLKDAYENNPIKRIHDELWPNYFKSDYNISQKILEQFEDKSKCIFYIIINKDYELEDLKQWNQYLNEMTKQFNFKRYNLHQDNHLGFTHLVGRTEILFKLILEIYSFEINIESKAGLKRACIINEYNSMFDGNIITWLQKKAEINFQHSEK